MIFNGDAVDRPEIAWFRGGRTYPEFAIRQNTTVDTGGTIYSGIGTVAPTATMTFNNGNVGIGTTAPVLAKLEIDGTGTGVGGAGLDLNESGVRSWYIGAGRSFSGKLAIGSGSGGDIMTIDGNNNVGIGTTSPGAKLDIYNSVISTMLSGDNIAMRNHLTGGGWARTLLTMEDDAGTDYFQFGALGSGQSFVSGFIGQAYDNSAISWDASNRVNIGQSSGFYDPLTLNASSTSNIGLQFRSTLFSTTNSPYSSGRILSGFNSNTYASAYLDLQYPTADNTFTTGIRLNNGNVGIGTTSPGAKLDIGGYGTPTIINNNSSAFLLGLKADYDGVGGMEFKNVNTGTAADSRFAIVDSTNHYLAFMQPAVTNTGGLIFGQARATTDFILNNGGTARNLAIGTLSAGDFVFATNGFQRMVIQGSGNVGIGTTTPASLLDINGVTTVRGNILPGANGTYALGGANAFSTGNFTSTLTAGRFVPTASAIVGNSMYLPAANTLGFSTNGTENVRIDSTGNVGIGTTGPNAKLDVAGTSLLNGLRIDGTLAETAIYKSGSYGISTSDGALLTLGSYPNYTQAVTIKSGNVGIGTTNPSNKLTVIGSICAKSTDAACAGNVAGTIYATNMTLQGADYAEYFYTTDTDLSPSEAVCVDVTKPNAVKRCSRTGDNNIMGVVSSNPSIVGNNADGRENDPHYKVIAMMGQIAAKVSAENGTIQIGDSLTGSSVAGYLRKANAGESTVGIAMQNFASDKGSIQVLISRRNQSLTVENVEAQVSQNIADMGVQDKVDNMISTAQDALVKQMADDSSKIASLTNQITTAGQNILNLENLTAILQAQMTELQSSIATPVNVAQIDLNTQSIDYLNQLLGITPDSAVGDITITGKLTAKTTETGQLIIAVNDPAATTIGEATIKAGETSVTVSTTAVNGESKVFITPVNSNPVTVQKIIQQQGADPISIEIPITWSVSEKTAGESFTIKTSQPVSEGMQFDWWIVDSK